VTAAARYLPAIIIAAAIMLAPLLWRLTAPLFRDAPAITGTAVDSAARIELELLRARADALEARLGALEERLDRQAALGPATYGAAPTLPGAPEAPNTIIDAYAQLVLIAERREINKGLTVASPAFLESLLGRPRDVLSDDCQEMTNDRLRALLVLEEVGPIRVRMLRPAVESLRSVFENVRAADQDLYDRINTSGSLCVRRIRGSAASLSSHAFGLALDLNIDGHLDYLADGMTQLGLTILADFFQAEGWIWGAGFGREDSMHFEVSRELLERWREEGLI
jgi:hypothetical protein